MEQESLQGIQDTEHAGEKEAHIALLWQTALQISLRPLQVAERHSG